MEIDYLCLLNRIKPMTIKDATLFVMNELCDQPTKQTEIVKRVVSLTGLSYESCRANAFRNPNAIPELWKMYKKIDINGRVGYIKGESEYRHTYNKPSEYYQSLEILNMSNKIYTLSGTESNCMSILDVNKTIRVDTSTHSKPDIKKDIFKIKDSASYNLDFEGILSEKKVKYINSLFGGHILLTFRSSKRDTLLSKINHKVIKSYEYKSGRSLMKSYLFSAL